MRTTLAALAIAAAGVAPLRGHAFTEYPSHWEPTALPVPYRVNAASAPASLGPDGALAAVEAGFDRWSAPICTAYRSTYQGPSTRGYTAMLDGENTVTWVTGAAGSWPPELGDEGSTLAATTPVWQGSGPFVEADLRFNAVAFAWSLDGAADTVDLQSIATHEAGHFLGLGHSADTSAVMYATYSGGLRRDLGSDDVAGVCALYPAGEVSDAGGGCSDGGACGDAETASGGAGCGCAAAGARGRGEASVALAVGAMSVFARRRRRKDQLL